MHSNENSPVAAPDQSPSALEALHAPRSPARLPELLAPAGDWECARAAVENGADAIYFGLEKFNARMRANNFTEADLPRLMEFLHRRGVKGYVTFNILVFENEMADAEQYVRTIIAAGVDAAVVQDVGICRLIRQHSPDFPIHVSTQMTITSAAGVEFARGFLGHREAAPNNVPAAHIADIFFTLLQRSVIGFGALVVVAAVVRFSVNKWKEDKWQR